MKKSYQESYKDRYGIHTYHWVGFRLSNEEGPAVIHEKDGEIISREWWVRGRRHRENGPAVETRPFNYTTREYGELQELYHLNGRHYATKSEWEQALKGEG